MAVRSRLWDVRLKMKTSLQLLRGLRRGLRRRLRVIGLKGFVKDCEILGTGLLLRRRV
jgi:hypothetical protein